MAYIVMACIVMAYIVMAYIVTAYIVMAYTVMACIVMAYRAMAYIVMACLCQPLTGHLAVVCQHVVLQGRPVGLLALQPHLPTAALRQPAAAL